MRSRLVLPPLGLFLALAAACGDDPVVPPAPPKNEGGAAGAEAAGGAGASAAGSAGATGDAGAAGTSAGQSGAGAGGAAPSGGGAGSGGAAVAAVLAAGGPVHGSLRDLGGGKMGLRLGDFPFACAEHPDDATCGATNRALVLADLPANAIVAGGAALAITGQLVATAPAPGCAKGAAAFTGSLTVTAVDATSVKVTLAGSSAAGFDGEHVLGRCTAAVAPGNAIAFRSATGTRIEAADFALSCAAAAASVPCGDRYRLDFTLPTGSAKGTMVGLATTPTPTFAATSSESSACKTDQGALSGQIEIVDVLGDRLRLRALGTNVAEANKTVYDALFCD